MEGREPLKGLTPCPRVRQWGSEQAQMRGVTIPSPRCCHTHARVGTHTCLGTPVG